jgi:hypothetical protein
VTNANSNTVAGNLNMRYFFTKTNLAILILAFVAGIIAFPIWVQHNRSHLPNSFVLSYPDFGPPSGSYELLGPEWYQWNEQGPDDPNGRDDVKIVIYRNVDLATVKRTYPVLKGKADYRYIEYSEAMGFLEKRIEELKADYNREPEDRQFNDELISEYERTKAKIVERLGS